MTDIVERLRVNMYAYGIAQEAADEIEKLRAECGIRQIDGYNRAKEQLAQWMIANSVPTGHGNTMDDLLMNLSVHLDELRQLIADWDAALKAKYEELILAVGNKYEGESRHQTALRYIKRAEEVVELPEQAAIGKEER